MMTLAMSTSPIDGLFAGATWRPIAHLSLQDRSIRDAIVAALERAGWTAIVHATGFDLVHAIAGVIIGDQPWQRPGLLVVDALARGCRGATIAAGLRDLGIRIPVVLVGGDDPAPPEPADDLIRHVDRANAVAVVAELARRGTGGAGLGYRRSTQTSSPTTVTG